MALIEVFNFQFILLYFYFCAVAYEYSVRGLDLPKLIALEATQVERERAAEEKRKKKVKKEEEKKQAELAQQQILNDGIEINPPDTSPLLGKD
jgi:hypothetical protein